MDPAQLERYGWALSGAPFALPPEGRALQPSPRIAVRLRRLLAQICRVAETKSKILSHSEVAQAMEQGSDRGVGHLFDDRQRPDRGLRQAPSCQDHGQVRRGLGGTSEPASAPAGTVRPDRGERPDPSVVLRGISRHGPHPVCAARRLKEVRLALRDAHPDKVKVAEVAHRFGFTRLGRFAGTYRATFGEAPSTTLQRTPGVPLTGP